MDIDTIYPIHMQEKHTKENERAGWSVVLRRVLCRVASCFELMDTIVYRLTTHRDLVDDGKA